MRRRASSKGQDLASASAVETAASDGDIERQLLGLGRNGRMVEVERGEPYVPAGAYVNAVARGERR